MIIKSYELNKINLDRNKFILFYGKNEGLKNEATNFFLNNKNKIINYEEKDIINNEENFFNNIFSKSFFDNEKLIIINRVSDKIKSILEEILEKKIDDIILILNANILDKKSKIRTLFEKNKDLICVPFYEDNNQTLSIITSSFFRQNKIPISQQTINLLVERSRGDRNNLKNELQKIENFIKDKKKIDIKDLLKLTSLAENYDASELIDCCLSKNKKRTISILNENKYSLEDCILIIRTFLMKTKRLAKLSEEFEKTRNIDATISNFKPPIFWKDKTSLKQQINKWSSIEVKNLIFRISEIELLIKKHSNNSINILSDFIIEQSTEINS